MEKETLGLIVGSLMVVAGSARADYYSADADIDRATVNAAVGQYYGQIAAYEEPYYGNTNYDFLWYDYYSALQVGNDAYNADWNPPPYSRTETHAYNA